MTDRNSLIKHTDFILALLEAVQLLSQVAVISVGAIRDGPNVSQGNSKADHRLQKGSSTSGN